MKFLYFEASFNVKEYIFPIIEIFSPSINIIKYDETEQSLIIYFHDTDISLQETVESFASDLYFQSFRVYESISYPNIEKTIKAALAITRLLKKIPYKDVYINNKIVLSRQIEHVDKDLKELVLNDYYEDFEMYKTIKVFLENNQNASIASKKLYLHRNTLNQRLEKFHLNTEFNVKEFTDAYLIYRIIK
ncbi:MAG: helix-turn-helix domain-containing protein [Acholeplasma sp.]|nr:helix-turn-helix domain-containing protein [Acholeplasma sp.]